MILVDLKVPQSSSKRAYCFIQYENMDMAYEARRAMDGHFIGKADCKIGYGMYIIIIIIILFFPSI